MTWETLLPQLLGPFGLLVGLLIVVVAFSREWVFTGAAMRRERRETEYWRQLALHGTSLAQKSLELAKARTQSARGAPGEEW